MSTTNSDYLQQVLEENYVCKFQEHLHKALKAEALFKQIFLKYLPFLAIILSN